MKINTEAFARYHQAKESLAEYTQIGSAAINLLRVNVSVSNGASLHLLGLSMVRSGLYEEGRFIVIYPEQNQNCDSAVNAYTAQLVSGVPSVSGFEAVPLERCLATLRETGDEKTAEALHARYLDFERVERAIFG